MNNNIALISLYGVENNGIRSISSVLKTDGFKTYLIFFKRWINNDICFPKEKEKGILLSLLKELNVGIVGFSFTSPFLKIAQELTKRLKADLSAKVVWGGIHATVKSAECLEYCDIVCRGEGEEVMLDLANALKYGFSLNGIKNICYKQEDRVIFENIRPLICNLDSLPYQDYGNGNKFFIEGDLKTVDPLIYARELRVMASRGCPFNCSYCYNSILRKLYKGENYHRIRSTESIISEIEYALSIFRRIRKIKFDDDTFIFPKDWIYRFCKRYKQSIGLPFEILFNAECTDEESLKRLKTAGLRRVQIGVQTGSYRESSEIYNRNLSLEKIILFALLSKKLRLNVVYDIILDNPLANLEDKEALVHFLLTLPRPFDLFLYSLTIFPGTKLYEILLNKGLIKPEDAEGYSSKSFYQFRLSFSYPRTRKDLFIVCIISLTSKSFLPKPLIALLLKSSLLKRHPLLLKWFAIFCNQVKLLYILIRMVLQREVNIWKFREYGLPKRFLIQ